MSCNSKPRGCLNKVDLLCTVYTGEKIPELNIYPGEDGQTVLQKIIDKTKDTYVIEKTSELLNDGEDFYLEFTISLGGTSGTAVTNYNRCYFGIGYSNTVNNLSINSLVNVSYTVGNGGGHTFYVGGNASGVVNTQSASYTVVIVKTGNIFRIISDTKQFIYSLSNNNGYSFHVNVVPRNQKQTVQGQLIKAFTF